jgi:hypothetical protein
VIVPRAVCRLFALSLLLAATPVGASSHLWEITEVYSNADGSVQYIELFTSALAQNSLMNHRIVATSNGVVSGTFTFGSNVPGSTQNRHLLIATTGFAALPGAVAPNYTLPCGFLDLSATTIVINFVGSDTLTFFRRRAARRRRELSSRQREWHDHGRSELAHELRG